MITESPRQEYKFYWSIFRLKPLPASIKVALAGSMLVGFISSAHSDPGALPIPAQQWLKSGEATKHIVGNALNIHQKSDKAILHWDSFNVGAQNQVNFQQPKTTSIALNRIFQQDASKVLGTVNANGQIYLYNKNGFVFGKNSTVNTNTLVATALDISDDVFNTGITKNFAKTGKVGLGNYDGNPDPALSKILVEQGAKLKVGENGRMILVAPNVTNKGSLEADKNGQIMLIASKDKVYLAENIVSDSAANKDFSGLLVEVGTGGTVENSKFGDVLAKQGNVTLAGFAVNQNGRVSATTSTKINGSIRLLAREGTADGTPGSPLIPVQNQTRTVRTDPIANNTTENAEVNFGQGSLTKVTPDVQDNYAIDEQKQPLSSLQVSAHTVHLQSGSTIKVPGGKVSVDATTFPDQPKNNTNQFGNYIEDGRVVIDAGARIDVSGTKNITASVERNVVAIPVQSYELRNSPLQKKGVLQGQTVRVDIRKNTAVVDTGGAEKRIERSIDERLGKGGTIDLTSGGEVIINPDAAIDVSGGSINYQSGFMNTSKLMTDYGAIIDISDADPNQHYSALLNTYQEVHQKWGVSQSWQKTGLLGKGNYEAGYIEGMDAGMLNIISPKMAWNGALIAGSANGIHQRTPETRAFGGAFNFNNKIYFETGSHIFSKQNVVLQQNGENLARSTLSTINFDGSAGKPADLVLSTDMLNKSGIQEINIETTGKATIAADATLVLTPGKARTLSGTSKSLSDPAYSNRFGLLAGQIDVNGSLYAPSGYIGLGSSYDAVADSLPKNDSSSNYSIAGNLMVGSTAKLDVSGRWINDFALGLSVIPSEGVAINGGKIALASAGDVHLQTGSRLHADGGARLSQNSELMSGNPGTIAIKTVTSDSVSNPDLTLNGEQSAFGLTEGGKLSLTVAKEKFTIGGDSLAQANSGEFHLGVTDSHFDLAGNKGFGAFDLSNSFGDLIIASGTELKLMQQNLVLNLGYEYQASGENISKFSTTAVLPDNLRKPVDLALKGASNVQLETGSRILADNRAEISLKSSGLGGQIFVDGLIAAPAGSINLDLTYPPASFYDGSQAIWLGQHASLQVPGVSILDPADALGRRSGEILAGGEVSLNTNLGYLILEQGSTINVSGAKDNLDILTGDTSGGRTQNAEIASAGGKINLTASEGIVTDGELLGRPGSAQAKGGTLAINFKPLNRLADTPNPPVDGNIVFNVRQNYQRQLGQYVKVGALLDDPALSLFGKATISSEQISKGGFDDLALAVANKPGFDAALNFQGDVDLSNAGSITLTSPAITREDSGSARQARVNLSTSYFNAIGDVTDQPVSTVGEGIFNAKAKWADFSGFSRWDGFHQININADQDIRAGNQQDDLATINSAKLLTAANLNLTAGQIYPSTLAKFTFAIDSTANPEGKITLAQNGSSPASPLSAGGELTFDAPTIVQAGKLKAPFGKLNLNAGISLVLAQDSLTSVSGAGLLIPFGSLLAGQNWIYGNTAYIAPPEKKLVISAPEINLAKGSTVDLSGGGDLLAYEFQPGIGGSSDYLGDYTPEDAPANYQGGFAVLPGLSDQLAPHDPIQSGLGHSPAVGSQVYLNGSDKLAAGFYTILPARYALLPGALLITPQDRIQDQQTTTFNTAGLPIVGGYRSFAGSGKQATRWNGYLVEDGSDIRKHSQYQEVSANSFFTLQSAKNETVAPLLPKDSGQLVIKNAQSKLAFDGDLKVDSADGGLGARLDIAAQKLNIVNNPSPTPTDGVLELSASSLNRLKVGSLLLGGERSHKDPGITDLAITSDEINFENGSQLTVSDLIAAATKKVTVKSGATLTATGNANTGDKQLRIAYSEDGSITSDGALLRLSSDRQVELTRTKAPGLNGDLQIEKGATISANKSMLLDASHSTSLAGNLQMQGGSLNLNANKVNLGEVGNLDATDSLNLSNAALAKLTVDELKLTGRDSINFYGNAALQNSVKNLLIDTGSLSGFSANGQTASLKSDNLFIQNKTGINATDAGAGTGFGSLNLAAKSYQQGEGDVDISGFKSVNIDAENDFTVAGTGKLALHSNFQINAGYLTAKAGKTLDIDATGYRADLGHQDKGLTLPDSTDFAGGIKLTADTINFNSKALLPSGKLELHSNTGDVVVEAASQIDLAGRRVQFGDIYDYTPGGEFLAQADQGKIVLAKGSSLNVNTGGGAAKSGSLSFVAPNKTVDLSGDLQAFGGSAKLDVASFSTSSGLDQILTKLNSTGISDQLSLRVRQSDLEISNGTMVNSNHIKLASDTGSINLSGQLVSDYAEQGGNIELYAGDNIVLKSGSVLSAKGKGPDASGGKVLLAATDADNVRNSGIEIKQGATIDVSGSKNQGGEIILRALRTDTDGNPSDDNIAIKPIAGTIKGVAHFYAEAVKKYGNADVGDDGAISTAETDELLRLTKAYMNPSTIKNVEQTLGWKIKLRPAIEIDYKGDLSLKDEWNLADWRFSASSSEQGVPGFLALNATGNITLRNSLTDGFATEIQTRQVLGSDYRDPTAIDPVTGGVPVLTVNQRYSLDKLMTDDAWSYAINAGADMAAADKTDIDSSTSSNISLTVKTDASGMDSLNPDFSLLNTYVRTGKGNIRLSASGNIEFGGGMLLDGSGTSIFDFTKVVTSPDGLQTNGAYTYKTAIYTAGKAEDGKRYGSFSDDYVTANYGYNSARSYAVAEYPLAGGDLRIRAGGNITGSPSAPVFQDIKAPWLVKQGNPGTTDGANLAAPTAWGIDFANFSGNVGVFGSGKAEISAGNDINDLSVAMPTTGKPVGNLVFDPNTQAFNAFNNKIQLNGGGDLEVYATGNIVGGSFLVGQGSASLNAGGNIRGSFNIKDDANPIALSSLSTGPLLLLGNTKVSLGANRDIALSAVSDPLVLPTNPNFPVQDTNFFSYGVNSGITATSLAGDLLLDNQTLALIDGSTFGNFANYYPASLNLTAFNGSDILKNSNSAVGIALFPSATGSLNILARDAISSFDDSTPMIIMSDAVAGELPRIDFPSLSATSAPHTPKPVHIEDKVPVRLATQEGNIENVKFILPKKSIVSSGNDIKNAAFSIQHANLAGDVSIISATRDISYPIPTATQLAPNEKGFEVAGTGDLLVKAGGNIDLGTSKGILSVGNGPTPVNTLDQIAGTNVDGNPNLSSTGARLTVIAGLNSAQPGFLDLAKLDPDVLTYADNFNKYQKVITEFMRNRTGNTKISTKTALEQFKQLDPAQYVSLQPQFASLASNKYKDILSRMQAEIVQFVRENQHNPALADDKAIALFSSLNPEVSAQIQPQLNALANQILFNELTETGSASAADPLEGNARGFKTIAALYPGTNWKGDISLAYSTIQSQKGGDINLLAPGGLINVGLPVAGVKKQDNELGIIASGKGAINAFLESDFNVNQSRVFALGGDDIMVWSSHGDIDAGRGAKSALAVSDPVFSFDADGNLIVDFPPPVAGSGIRTAAPENLASSEAGNVGLFAPGGIVNAGEAGIGGNNVTISATAVLGANNIDVGGTSTGVPVTSTVSLAAGLTGASNVAANASKMAQANADMSKRDNESKKDGKNTLGTISVELLGFGA